MRYSSQSCEMSITHFYLRSSNASIYTAYVDVSPLWHLSIRFIMGKGCQRKYAHIEFLSWFESQHMCLVLSQPWQRSPSGLHIALSAWGFRRRQEASSRHCQKPHCTEHALWPGTTHPLARTPLHFSNLSDAMKGIMFTLIPDGFGNFGSGSGKKGSGSCSSWNRLMKCRFWCHCLQDHKYTERILVEI